jgi:hypothetical protein
MYRRTIALFLLTGMAAAPATQAGFLDQLKNVIEDAAKETTKTLVAQKTSEIIRDMFIEYTSEQTRTEDEVTVDYTQVNGNLPMNPTIGTYRTSIEPGNAVSPGTPVKVKSWVEVVPGRSGNSASVEETLTIWDNEDSTLPLKSMTKMVGQAGSKGGEFRGEFTFSLPEGLPQGVYPVSTSLTLNGESAGDRKHQLQLVLDVRDDGAQLVALAPNGADQAH